MAEVTYLEAIRQALFEEMDRDPVGTAAGRRYRRVRRRVQGDRGTARTLRLGARDRYAASARAAIVGAAVGMSYVGLRPVAEMQFIDFIACCFNQITNFAAKSHYRWGAPVPIVIRGPAGGGVHGGPFHSANPEMYFVHTPGLKVVCPATAYDAKGC